MKQLGHIYIYKFAFAEGTPPKWNVWKLPADSKASLASAFTLPEHVPRSVCNFSIALLYVLVPSKAKDASPKASGRASKCSDHLRFTEVGKQHGQKADRLIQFHGGKGELIIAYQQHLQ